MGTLIAVKARGTLMGNRGCLHDAQGRITGRRWTTRAWICCVLEFQGRKRRVMAPGRYTELFFLDEATAFSAGHRPCGECRRAAHALFRHYWMIANSHLLPEGELNLAGLDRVLHDERLAREERRERWLAPLDILPNGAMVLLSRADEPWLVLGGELLKWAPSGYRERIPRPPGATVVLLTPPSLIGVLASGYPVEIHTSANKSPPRSSRRPAPGKAARKGT